MKALLSLLEIQKNRQKQMLLQKLLKNLKIQTEKSHLILFYAMLKKFR